MSFANASPNEDCTKPTASSEIASALSSINLSAIVFASSFSSSEPSPNF